ncbi:hypothetical protein [Streptomyces sp. KLOTTS4A1]|uniref:hypothetical protein n=1 Tax=Streptomyces sp. KLOTTS4A1 TaxID=3390996 RepID=UPI0039F52384
MNARTASAALAAGVLAFVLVGCSGTEELSYGDTAEKDNLEVTVVRVDAGTPGDLSVLEDADKYRDRTPYYVRFRVTKSESGDVEGPSFDVMADGDRLTRLNIMSALPKPVVGEDGQLRYEEAPKFDKCLDEHDSAAFEKAPAGESYEACSIYLAEPGSGAPDKVEWVKGGLLRSSEDQAFAVWK